MARPIRDPRLLRQQQQKLQQQQHQLNLVNQAIVSNPPVVSTTTSVPAQKTSVLENNKNVTNKLGVRDIPKDPRLSSKLDKKSKHFPKSRDQPAPDLGPSNTSAGQKTEKSSSRSNNRSDPAKPSEGSSVFNSSSSNSLTSSTSSLDSPTKTKRSSSKHKKRDKPESKRSQEYDGSSSKREKVSSSKEDVNKYNEAVKNATSDASSSFKSVKNKNRNYMRRNLVDSPVLVQDEDLRSATSQPEKNRVQSIETASVEQKCKCLFLIFIVSVVDSEIFLCALVI